MNRSERATPPEWMEQMLRMFLPAHHRETIAGDLREAFHEHAVSDGGGRARLWYLRQTLSFLPRTVGMRLGRGPALPLLCAFTGLCGLWLGAMDIRLGHPASQIGIASAILLQALVTLGALGLRYRALRYLSLAGCVGMFALSARALAGVLSGDNFEGYILLIALLLAVQSILTVCTMPWLQRPASTPRG